MKHDRLRRPAEGVVDRDRQLDPNAPAAPPQLATLREVANRLRCTTRHVQKLRATGRFPRPDWMCGRGPRWRLSTIERWLEAQAPEVRRP
jgi:predicted DNA-binding transcriptional regulator AlpA